MSQTDPISDLLTRIRNAQAINKVNVKIPFSIVKLSICQVLLKEGYISACNVNQDNAFRTIDVELKYYQGKPVIKELKRISKPGLRVYKAVDALPKIMGGYGAAIVSTSKGIMTDTDAKKLGIGGEVLCSVA